VYSVLIIVQNFPKDLGPKARTLLFNSRNAMAVELNVFILFLVVVLIIVMTTRVACFT